MSGPSIAVASAPQPRKSFLRTIVPSFFILMVDGYDSLVVAFIAPLLVESFGMTPTEMGRLFVAAVIGSILGAILLGRLCDRYGRKPVLMASLLLMTVTTYACAFAESYEQLLVLRFIAGIGLGGAGIPAIALTADNCKPEHRASMVTLLFIGFPLGAGLGAASTAAVISSGWEMIFIYTAIACVFAVFAACFLPENRIKPSSADAEPAAGGGLRGASRAFHPDFLKELLADGRFWPAIWAWLAFFSLMTLTSAMTNWMPSLVVSRGGTPENAAFAGALLMLGGIAGTLCSIPLIQRWGPYFVIALMTLVGTGLVILVGISFGSYVVLATIIGFMGFCLMGAQLNFPGTMVELFPPLVRGSGSGISMAIGRCGSILGPLVGGAMIAANIPQSSLFQIGSLLSLVSAIAMFATGWLRRRAKLEGSPGTPELQ